MRLEQGCLLIFSFIARQIGLVAIHNGVISDGSIIARARASKPRCPRLSYLGRLVELSVEVYPILNIHTSINLHTLDPFPHYLVQLYLSQLNNYVSR